MRRMTCCNEIFRVENPFLVLDYVINIHGIYVVNKHSRVDFIPGNAQITAIITYYDIISCCFPLPGAVEPLIEIPVETECLTAYRSMEDEVFEAFLEGSEAPKLRILTTRQS